MSYNSTDPAYQYQGQYYGPTIAAQAETSERIAFIQRTYLHLTGAIIAFGLIQLVIFGLFYQQVATLVPLLFGTGWMWLVVLGAFMGVSFLADYWARSNASQAMQYAGLGLYVLAEALIFVPILYIAGKFFPGAIENAGIATLIVFVGLSTIVYVTKADFSFLRVALYVIGLAALAAIVGSIVMGISLGLWFAVAMVVFIALSILYQTSNMLHHYNTQQHVAAALGLFASIATMFWYMIQIFMHLQND